MCNAESAVQVTPLGSDGAGSGARSDAWASLSSVLGKKEGMLLTFLIVMTKYLTKAT